MALGGVAWRLGDEHNGCEAGGSAATIGLAVLDLAMDHVVRQAAPEEKQLGIQTPPVRDLRCCVRDKRALSFRIIGCSDRPTKKVLSTINQPLSYYDLFGMAPA